VADGGGRTVRGGTGRRDSPTKLGIELPTMKLDGINFKTKLRILRTYLGIWRGGRSTEKEIRANSAPTSGSAPSSSRACAECKRERDEVQIGSGLGVLLL
jgi:hypothetical protein